LYELININSIYLEKINKEEKKKEKKGSGGQGSDLARSINLIAAAGACLARSHGRVAIVAGGPAHRSHARESFQYVRTKENRNASIRSKQKAAVV
jgi:hypothetical protein